MLPNSRETTSQDWAATAGFRNFETQNIDGYGDEIQVQVSSGRHLGVPHDIDTCDQSRVVRLSIGSTHVGVVAAPKTSGSSAHAAFRAIGNQLGVTDPTSGLRNSGTDGSIGQSAGASIINIVKSPPTGSDRNGSLAVACSHCQCTCKSCDRTRR